RSCRDRSVLICIAYKRSLSGIQVRVKPHIRLIARNGRRHQRREIVRNGTRAAEVRQRKKILKDVARCLRNQTLRNDVAWNRSASWSEDWSAHTRKISIAVRKRRDALD